MMHKNTSTKINIDKNLFYKIKSGYLWIFNNEVKVQSIEDGQIIDFYYDRKFVAKAYYNSKSKIAFRVINFEDKEIDSEFWFYRFKNLYEWKSSVYGDNFRLVYSEGDFLPGLIIDLFTTVDGKKIAVVMLLTLGIERQKENIFKALKKLGVDCIIEKSDSNLRKLEGLELRRGIEFGKIEIPFKVKIDDIYFLIDPLNGQKTGYYFDQTENRRFLRSISQGSTVLDVFSYIGAFSLYALKGGAKFVELVDESAFVSSVIPKIMELNNFQTKYIFHNDNAFAKMREFVSLGKSFSIVILDPPSFTKTKEKKQNALKAYFDINNIALRLVQNGGYLVSSSCSQKVREEELLDVIRSAFFKQGVIGSLVYIGKQSLDHPINLAMEETNYLKFFVFRVYHR